MERHGKKNQALTRTKLAGNQPSLSRILPHHHSLLVASITSMTSPALNPSSWSSIVTWSQRASAYTTLPSLMSCGQRTSNCQCSCSFGTIAAEPNKHWLLLAPHEKHEKELSVVWQVLQLTLLSVAFVPNHLGTVHLPTWKKKESNFDVLQSYNGEFASASKQGSAVVPCWWRMPMRCQCSPAMDNLETEVWVLMFRGTLQSRKYSEASVLA